MVKSQSLLVSFAIIAMLPSGLAACARADPLSVLPSPNGELLLRDTLLAPHDRIICVSHSLADECSSRTAEVYVTDLESTNSLSVRWESDTVVLVEMNGGKIVRSTPTSRRGGVTIRVVKPRPAIPIIIPGNSDVPILIDIAAGRRIWDTIIRGKTGTVPN